MQDSEDQWAYGELVRRVRLSPSRDWVSSYLDLIAELVLTADLANDDSRLSLTMPGAKHKSPAIRVNVNNRWVLVNHTRKEGYLLGIIYGPEYEYQPELGHYVQRSWRFDPLWSEQSAMSATPYFLWLRNDLESLLPEELQFGWLDAIVAEVHRAKGSPYRKYHQPVVYKAVMDKEYREMVLDEAFANG